MAKIADERCPETGWQLTPRLKIQPDWIDYNGHLNIAFYVKLFDNGIDIIFDRHGLGASYVNDRKLGFFSAELHVRYLRELHLSDDTRVRMRVLDVDRKRIHYWMELIHADEGWLSATMEIISLHMDMTERRVAPMPDDVFAILDGWRAEQASKPPPEGVGRVIGIPRRT